MSRRWDSLDVGGSRMRCYLTLPEGNPVAGVLVCMHAPGVDDFIQGICDRLAGAGLAAVAPDLYHRQSEPEDNPLRRMAMLKDAEILCDFASATGHLRGLDAVDSDRTGVIGFCMGGRLAYIQASADEAVRAAVVFYGGNMFNAWGEGPTPFERLATLNSPVRGRRRESEPPGCGEDRCRAPAPRHLARVSQLRRRGPRVLERCTSELPRRGGCGRVAQVHRVSHRTFAVTVLGTVVPGTVPML